jgi:uncharacterized protein YbaA (DUF1428 family)
MPTQVQSPTDTAADGGRPLENLKEDLKSWLRDENVLQQARKKIEEVRIKEGSDDDTLKMTDTRVANWLRSDRALPEALIMGAALGCVASAGQQTGSNPTKITAKEFWQLFTIKPPSLGNAKCDGEAFRYWTDVQAKSDETVYFSHQSYYSANLQRKKVALDIFTRKLIDEQQVEEDKENGGPAGRVTVSWKLTGREPTSFGYSVPAENVISADNSKEELFDYVGGMSSIPVDRAIVVVKLPAGILAQTKPHRLHWLQFLQGTTSFGLIEDHLSEKLHSRYLGPWFNWLGGADPISKNALGLPKPLQEHLGDSDDGYLYFRFEIVKPEPFLTYLAAFELRKTGIEE